MRVNRFGVFRASHRSIRRCVFNQKSGELPKTRPNIKAVSAVTARRLRHNSLMCFRGNPVCSAISDWVISNGSINSLINISPTVTGRLLVINIKGLHVATSALALLVRMVVQINFCGFAFPPLEYKPPLIIDSYRMPTLQLSAQLLEMIARWNSKVRVRSCIIEQLQLAEQSIA